MNKELAKYSTDDSGDFFCQNNRLYVYQGNGGIDGRAGLQTFTLSEFALEGVNMWLISKRETKHRYAAYGKRNPLIEFGFDRLISWSELVKVVP